MGSRDNKDPTLVHEVGSERKSTLMEVKLKTKTLHQPIRMVRDSKSSYADVTQLVEYDLAKVDVASSSLVVRSKMTKHAKACILEVTKHARLTQLARVSPLHGESRGFKSLSGHWKQCKQ